MITQTEPLCILSSYEEAFLPEEEDLLFFDIETTGLSAKTSALYLIGTITRRKNIWRLTQWMAQSPEEECALLEAFQDFAAPYSRLIHFNGTTFDLPYLRRKYAHYGLDFTLDEKNSLDLLQRIRPVKKILCLERLNQTSLETFLGIPRKDTMDGGRLIPVYHQYVHNHSPELGRLLFLHNHDDLVGMAKLLPMLSYPDLFAGKFQVSGCELGEEHPDSFSLIFRLRLEHAVPKPLSCKLTYGYLKVYESEALLLVPGYKGVLKHFFPNYKDYYYLPLEDTAIHKSVGAYVDRDHREQAKASTCYIQKPGAFLPCPGMLADRFSLFQAEYGASVTYVECTPDFLSDTALQLHYCRSLCSLPD